MTDTYLCNKRLLLKQRGDSVAWQINFPLPRTHLISHEALIQPLLSPLASADWLTYGIALFCFSSSPRSPENQTLLPVNLFWFFFLFGKRKYHFPFLKNTFRTPWIKHMSLSDAAYRWFISMWTATNRWDNAIARDLSIGVLTSQMLAFSTVIQKVHKGVSFYIG